MKIIYMISISFFFILKELFKLFKFFIIKVRDFYLISNVKISFLSTV